ncbi:hypothetical protein V6N11_038521 [Hibiscus sabdariffa]|uniref:Uncharacterized protein n=1 Tax=Hibiscus sabdariffa TaxID=183260 RepID=A0ABR2SK76_9ROSI
MECNPPSGSVVDMERSSGQQATPVVDAELRAFSSGKAAGRCKVTDVGPGFDMCHIGSLKVGEMKELEFDNANGGYKG